MIGGWNDEGRHRRPRKKLKQQQSGSSITHVDGIDVRYRSKKSGVQDLVANDRLVRVWHPEIDEKARLAMMNLTKYPDIWPYISVMPDFHVGESNVNGTVIPTMNTLYVNAIGGDIGCGMACMRLPLSLSDIESVQQQLFKEIHARVPVGRRVNIRYDERVDGKSFFQTDLEIMNKANTQRAKQSLGTLGSGNHFIEVQVTELGEVYVMVHTGSRMLGQNVRKAGIQRGHNAQQPRGLVTMAADSEEGKEYLRNAEYAVQYATENRREILYQVFLAFQALVPQMSDVSFDSLMAEYIDTPHNFISREEHFGRQLYVHRKGAVYVPKGELSIIPGSMGSYSHIVRGKGNRFSFHSSSHGAGRALTRHQALSRISYEEYLAEMEGIACRQDRNILDEARGAYKDISQVMRHQRDLVSIYETLYPFVVVKG